MQDYPFTDNIASVEEAQLRINEDIMLLIGGYRGSPNSQMELTKKSKKGNAFITVTGENESGYLLHASNGSWGKSNPSIEEFKRKDLQIDVEIGFPQSWGERSQGKLKKQVSEITS